jgi:hypothetical protein
MHSERTRQLISIGERVRTVRLERFGDDVEVLAEAMELPPRTWLNYERGVTMPAEIMLRFLVMTGTDPEWLLTGKGRKFGVFSFES